MPLNTDINSFNQYSTRDAFTSESEMYAKLNQMKAAIAHENDELEKELLKKRYEEELKYQTKRYDFALKAEKKYQKAIDDYNKKQESAKKKASEEDQKRYFKQLEDRRKKEVEEAEKSWKEQQAKIKKYQDRANAKKALGGSGYSLSQRIDLLDEGGLGGLISGIADLSKKLDKQIDTIATYQSKWDTRLLGTGKTFEGANGISKAITGIVGVSPLVQQNKVMSKIDELVNKGIAYNVEQRAFLGTISEKIATTFDAANGTLLQLVRVQQSDTTAARLGMENYLNTFLNSMYNTTEYLSSVSSNVKSALYEATAQLSSTQGVGFEYQVQKWLGSLYSVGMSQNAIQSIAQGLGYLGSGNVSALNSNQALQNLLVMSASRAGLNYADLLSKGLDESNTNRLLASMVTYLQEIANSNKVVQSQYASVFGLSMSDISAAKNLRGSISSIAGSYLDYGGAMNNLYNAASSMYSRTGIGEMMSNVWENTKYAMSSGIANNPALYAIWKASNLLTDVVGGIDFSVPLVLGTGTTQTFNVADMMKVGALSASILSSMSAMINAGSGGGFDAAGMLNALGLSRSSVSTLTRGSGISSMTRGSTVSQSSYVGNASSSDIYSSTTIGATDETKQQVAEAQEEDTSVKLDQVDKHVVDIFNLINSLSTGSALRVKVEDYGLNI